MAYQFTDSFDHYNTAFLTAGNLYDQLWGSPVISSSYARFPAIAGFPNQGIYIPGAAGIRKNLKSNQGTLIAFFSFGVPNLPASGWVLVAPFWDNGTCQCYVAVSSTGQLALIRQVSTYGQTILAASAPGLIAPSAVPNHGIEVAVTFSASAGSVELWLDGAVVIPLTGGLNTIVSANAYANQAGLGSSNSLGLTAYQPILSDYFRVWDNSGSYQNALVGYDVRKLTKLPQGAGALTQWTANGAAADWDCVNDASPDGDTTYVSSSGLNSDSYAMGSSGLSGLPSQVVVKSYVRKDDGATRTLQIGVRSGSSNGLGAAATMGSTYAWVDGCISVDPATSSPPTAAAADAFQHLKYEAS